MHIALLCVISAIGCAHALTAPSLVVKKLNHHNQQLNQLHSKPQYNTALSSTLVSGVSEVSEDVEAKIEADRVYDRAMTAALDEEIKELALPALAGIVIDPMLSLIDTAWVTQLGGNALASLGPCTSVFHFAYAVPRALTISTSTLIAAAGKHVCVCV